MPSTNGISWGKLGQAMDLATVMMARKNPVFLQNAFARLIALNIAASAPWMKSAYCRALSANFNTQYMKNIFLLAAILASGCAYNSLFDSECWLRANKKEFHSLDSSNGKVVVTFARAVDVRQSLIGIDDVADGANCAFFEKNGVHFLIIISQRKENVLAREYEMQNEHWKLIKEVKALE